MKLNTQSIEELLKEEKMEGGSQQAVCGRHKKMTAEEYLEQVRIKNAKINNLLEEKEHLRGMLFFSDSRLDSERVQTSMNTDKFGTLYSKIEEKEQEINRKINELADFRLKVIDEINTLEDERYIRILYKHYVQLVNLAEIAEDMHYNFRYIQILNRQAIKDFEQKYVHKFT